MSKWYELAQAEKAKGIAEYAGTSKNNPAILQYYRDVGVPQKHDEVAWCAAFVGSVLERSGIRSSRSLMARSYQNWGRKLDKPREGCIVVFWRNSLSSGYGHVGFYVRETKDFVYVLGGNQGDRISIAPYPKTRVLGYRWPKDDAPEAKPVYTDAFKAAVNLALQVEGGFTDHPRDPGGATNKGILITELANHLGIRLTDDTRPGVLKRLKAITDEEVAAIYHKNYWLPVDGDQLPKAIAVMTFDTALLHGVEKGVRYLQEALGVTIDGDIGPETLGAAKGSAQGAVLKRYRDIRIRQLSKSKNWDVFGRGWTNRVNTVFEKCMTFAPAAIPSVGALADAMAKDPTLNTTNTTLTGGKPMSVDTTSTEPSKHWTQSLTIWGTIVTFLATVVPTIGPMFGINITADMVQAFGEAVTQLITAGGGLVGIVMTILGRVRATTPIGLAKVNIKI